MSKQSIEEFLSAHAFFSKMYASFLKLLADTRLVLADTAIPLEFPGPGAGRFGFTGV